MTTFFYFLLTLLGIHCSPDVQLANSASIQQTRITSYSANSGTIDQTKKIRPRINGSGGPIIAVDDLQFRPLQQQ